MITSMLGFKKLSKRIRRMMIHFNLMMILYPSANVGGHLKVEDETETKNLKN